MEEKTKEEKTKLVARSVDPMSTLRFVSVLAQATVEALHRKGIITYDEVVDVMKDFTDAYEEAYEEAKDKDNDFIREVTF